jgi:hypothetical protein
MGLTGPIPDHILRLMAPADRPRGKAGKLMSELLEKREFDLERKEQGRFAGLLNFARERGELLYDWSRTDKRTRNRKGRADFWIMARGRGLQIEFKAPGGRLSPAQKDEKEKAEASGTIYKIVHSADEAWQLTKFWLEQ